MILDVSFLHKHIKNFHQIASTGKMQVIILAILMCPFLVSIPAGAVESPLVFSSSTKELILGPYIEILEDNVGNLGIDDVSSPPYNSRFIPL
jgi:hypothetical protein